MSKITLTDAQVNDLYMAGHDGECLGESYESMLNMAIKLGLVRPASDDLAARVAALEAYINGDEPGVPPNVRPPDPHAAAKDEFQKALDRVDARAEKIVADIPPGQRAIISQSEAKPRTEADRLGEVAYNEYWADDEVCSWEECHDDTRGQWSTIALAVRKADRASQLEPSEEEHKAANMAYLECSSANVDTAVKAALIAAARVRLEKAEGEQ